MDLDEKNRAKLWKKEPTGKETSSEKRSAKYDEQGGSKQAQEQMIRREQLEVKTSSDSTTVDAIKSTSWYIEPGWLRSNQLSKQNRRRMNTRAELDETTSKSTAQADDVHVEKSEVKKSQAGKPDQGRENLIKEPQQLDAYDGEEEGCCSGRRNQLGRKPVEKPDQERDLSSMMNKVAQSSSRADDKKRTARSKNQLR
ncbi:pentatricopeptide repeat-containing protein-like [Dorcoceras hygrometricum]|uniref:Pentatricopeptide repeat-containing protein-like n=1 Tax=Dorcoceras hygrometricum TaxID=472368 RepID=A0A2Z7BAD1_9LAMI|nr:pentatricopeptide repeat-containing protein-like [Dorcoceras hygrometricum]